MEQHEEHLQEQLRGAHAPFLGLLGGLVPEAARQVICDYIGGRPLPDRFAEHLERYPALLGIWLAEHIMDGLGQGGHLDVYHQLEHAIGGAPFLNEESKKRLWRGFRRAMRDLGIQPLARTSGPGYMTDEYVRQAGVPLAFADPLASKMLQHAKRVGLPDEDDQEGLCAWQSALVAKLNPPFSKTARRAVERDQQGYYTRTFLRVHANHGCPAPGDKLGAAFARAFETGGSPASIRRAAMLQLVYQDGVIGILFPSSQSGARYALQIGDTTTEVCVSERGEFIALPSRLPPDIHVLNALGERVFSVNLWKDNAANRLLIFTSKGRLRASAQLGQADDIELVPGDYVALCRFSPTDIAEQFEVSESPRLVEVPITVGPGEEFQLKNGPAAVNIVGENLPTVRVSGQSKVSLERVEFLYGDLLADVNIPPDWRDAQGLFELRISSADRTESEALSISDEGHASIELGSLIRRITKRAGLFRFVVELGRRGEARALQRQSLLYWHGLNAVTSGMTFELSQLPANLVAPACAGLVFEDTSAKPSSDIARMIRLAFDLGDGRVLHLSWYRQGFFIEVSSQRTDGTFAYLPRQLGSTETVALTNPKRILVYGWDKGALCVGGWSVPVDFSKSPSKELPASLLASRLAPGANKLMFKSNLGAEKLLLRLSQPRVVSDVRMSRVVDRLEMHFKVHGVPLTDIVIIASDINSARELRIEQPVQAGDWSSSDFGRMQCLTTSTDGITTLDLLLDTTTIPEGSWILTFEACILGTWGKLEDGDEGRIALTIAVDSAGNEVSADEQLDAVNVLELPAAIVRLNRLNQYFRQFWSPLCWTRVKWLSVYWSRLVGKIRGHEADFVTQLADMAMCEPDAETRQGWVSKWFIGAQLPHLYCLHRFRYQGVNVKPNSLSVNLRAMTAFKGNVLAAFQGSLHPVVPAAFDNIMEMMRGMRPHGFDLSRYIEAVRSALAPEFVRLSEPSERPKDGDLLGPFHLAHAWQELEQNFGASQLMANERSTLAQSVARSLLQRAPVFGGNVPAGLQGKKLVIRARELAPDLEESEEQRQDSLTRIANACAWLAWNCRLEARQPGALQEFFKQLHDIRRTPGMLEGTTEDCLSYYLQLAPSLFGYYALLWELVQTIELDPAVQDV